MEWTDDEIRQLFDEWFERMVDQDKVDERDYKKMLMVYVAGFRDGLVRV